MPALLPPSRCYTGTECAAMLGLSRARFYRLRKELEAQGMPEPITVGGRHLRYSKAAFDAWLNSPRRDKPPQPAAANDALPQSLRERFDREYG